MRALFMMVCVFMLTMGMAFAEESHDPAGSFCEEGGKTPASISSTNDEAEESSGSVQE